MHKLEHVELAFYFALHVVSKHRFENLPPGLRKTQQGGRSFRMSSFGQIGSRITLSPKASSLLFWGIFQVASQRVLVQLFQPPTCLAPHPPFARREVRLAGLGLGPVYETLIVDFHGERPVQKREGGGKPGAQAEGEACQMSRRVVPFLEDAPSSGE